MLHVFIKFVEFELLFRKKLPKVRNESNLYILLVFKYKLLQFTFYFYFIYKGKLVILFVLIYQTI